VAFGTKWSPSGRIESFYAPAAADLLHLRHAPVLLEIISKGTMSGGGLQRKLESQIPLVKPSRAQDASVKSIQGQGRLGDPRERQAAVYGGCAQMSGRQLPFGQDRSPLRGLGGLPPQTVTVEYKAPCPRR